MLIPQILVLFASLLTTASGTPSDVPTPIDLGNQPLTEQIQDGTGISGDVPQLILPGKPDIGTAVEINDGTLTRTTWYVDDNCASPGSGTQNDPFCTIQAGINAAANGDEVVVSAGTYPEHIDFLGKAITVRGTNPEDSTVVAATIIDGTNSGSVVSMRSGEGAGYVLSGFSLINGIGSYRPGSPPSQGRCGGGLFIWESSPTITHCVIRNNTSEAAAAIYCRSGAGDPIISNCIIQDNVNTSTSSLSGVVYLAKMNAPINHPRLLNCVLINNTSQISPSALLIGGSVEAEVRNCTITGNQNLGTYEGVGPVLVMSAAHLSNSIVWNNVSADPSVPVTVMNQMGPPASLEVRYSDIEGGQNGVQLLWSSSLNWGDGNLDADPLFMDVASGNFHLRWTSPCRDAGDPTFVPDAGETDIDGDPRVGDGNDDGIAVVDIGADESFIDCSRNGTSDECAVHVPEDYPNIQAALDAVENGFTVWVASGMYTGAGNSNLDFKGKIIALQCEEIGTCIIDHAVNVPAFNFHLNETNASIVDGFRITNCSYTSPFHCRQSSPTIRNCIIAGNPCAGILCDNGDHTIIENCTITGNHQGIFCSSSGSIIRNCTISGNTPNGGISIRGNSMIDNCSIIGNAGTSGVWSVGGIEVGGNTIVRNCTISGNTGRSVGGIRAMPGQINPDDSPIIQNCIISGNTAQFCGGVFFLSRRPTMQNCTVFGNVSSQYGGGIRCSNDSSPTIGGCIIWGNTAPNGPQIYLDGSSSVTVSYSDVQGGWTGEGNIDLDPLFVDFAGGNLHLRQNSPCIDFGDPAFVPGAGETDFDGQSRLVDGDGDGVARVDMGAYEHVYFDSGVCGDLDEDGDVDYDDYAIILHAMGHISSDPQYLPEADYDDDGAVSLVDYRTWFNCYRNFVGNPNAPVPIPPPPPGGSPSPVPAPKPIPQIQPISPTAEISKSPVGEPTQ